MHLPPPASKEVIDALANVVGEDGVSVASVHRHSYCRDMLPVSLMRQIEGRTRHFPDVIVWPRTTLEVARIMELCPELNLPIIPYGAGSGVCGGTLPVRGGVILDLKRMDRILEINDEDLTVRAQPGIMGQTLEMELDRRGYTLGHFPSSIYCSTLGGWVATRSAGQQSSLYGKIEDMVLSMEFVLPGGEIVRTTEAPGSAAGPDWKQLFIGSEGTLGVVTEATCRIRPKPASRRFIAFNFPDVNSGVEAMRLLMRNGLRPAVMRLYDPLDTLLVGSKGAEDEAGSGLLDHLPLDLVGARLQEFAPGLLKKAKRFVARWADLVNNLDRIANQGCLLVLMFEGDERLSRYEFEASIRLCEKLGGENRGPEPALAWHRNRYHVSYKMTKVYYNQAFVDTIEVAATWDRIVRLYEEIRAAIKPMAFIMAHFSHAYSDGCSIYFTFVSSAKDSAEAEKRHAKIWKAAMEPTIRLKGTISHHHGVGLLKAPFMKEELGDMMRVFRDLKDVMDPEHQLNPGKLGL